MSKSSRSKSSKSKRKQGHNQKESAARRQRKPGTWLTVALVVDHSSRSFSGCLLTAVARLDPTYLDRPWALWIDGLAFPGAIVVAADWHLDTWSENGARTYMPGRLILALVIGLVTVGIWSVFYMVLPWPFSAGLAAHQVELLLSKHEVNSMKNKDTESQSKSLPHQVFLAGLGALALTFNTVSHLTPAWSSADSRQPPRLKCLSCRRSVQPVAAAIKEWPIH